MSHGSPLTFFFHHEEVLAALAVYRSAVGSYQFYIHERRFIGAGSSVKRVACKCCGSAWWDGMARRATCQRMTSRHSTVHACCSNFANIVSLLLLRLYRAWLY